MIGTYLQAALAALLILSYCTAESLLTARRLHNVAFLHSPQGLPLTVLVPRGGATTVDSDDEDDDEESAVANVDEDEEDEEEGEGEDDRDDETPAAKVENQAEEEETTAFDAALAASAVKSVSKTKKATEVKSVSRAKMAVNEKLAPKKKKKKSLRIPYIMKACLNPITVFTMTKAYWASLFNLDYLKQEQSQDLRSALEEKAKRSTDNTRGRKKMKRGQSKSLSDLPQLST